MLFGSGAKAFNAAENVDCSCNVELPAVSASCIETRAEEAASFSQQVPHLTRQLTRYSQQECMYNAPDMLAYTLENKCLQ
jgi:hypothetical protein